MDTEHADEADRLIQSVGDGLPSGHELTATDELWLRGTEQFGVLVEDPGTDGARRRASVQLLVDAVQHARRYLVQAGGRPPSFHPPNTVYAPASGPRLITPSRGGEGVVFRASASCMLGIERQPWADWHEVGPFDCRAALNEFRRIKTSEHVRAFAGRYGPLWVCCLHPPSATAVSPTCLWDGHPMLEAGQHEFAHRWANIERVDWWLHETTKIDVVVRCAARLKAGDVPTERDWCGMRLDELNLAVARESAWSSHGAAAAMLAAIVNAHLKSHHVGTFVAEDLRLRTVFGYGILPVLWRQVLSEITGAANVAFCSECGDPYMPKRAPKRGTPNDCPDCRPRAARRRYARRQQAARPAAKPKA